MAETQFSFYISGEEKKILPGTGLWNLPLAGNSPSRSKAREPEISIGDYFTACEMFLSENNFSLLKIGLEKLTHGIAPAADFDRVDVFLEKHGAFYHPLKIQTRPGNQAACFFVLNGAVSEPGLSLIQSEYQWLLKLTTQFRSPFLPAVFGTGQVRTDKGCVGFFLGQWFDGYKEFHATQHQGVQQIVIWESDGRCDYLLLSGALPIYQEISRILTLYYDLETFMQIFPWHHAAGDFVVRQVDKKFHVRLITVRGYVSLSQFDTDGEDPERYILPSLLIFFLNLTIRIRLDRLDGTGEPVLLNEKIIEPVIKGFFQALDEKTKAYPHGELESIFIAFYREFSLKQVTTLFENIFESCPLSLPEKRLVDKNLKSHCRFLDSIMKTF